MEVGLRFPVFCVCSLKNQEKIKRKSIFVFPFLCFLVHKRKNDKTEVIFRFSVFCVCLFVHKRKNDKTEVEFRFSFFCISSFEKTKNDKTEVKFCLSFLRKR